MKQGQCRECEGGILHSRSLMLSTSIGAATAVVTAAGAAAAAAVAVVSCTLLVLPLFLLQLMLMCCCCCSQCCWFCCYCCCCCSQCCYCWWWCCSGAVAALVVAAAVAVAVAAADAVASTGWGQGPSDTAPWNLPGSSHMEGGSGHLMSQPRQFSSHAMYGAEDDPASTEDDPAENVGAGTRTGSDVSSGQMPDALAHLLSAAEAASSEGK